MQTSSRGAFGRPETLYDVLRGRGPTDCALMMVKQRLKEKDKIFSSESPTLSLRDRSESLDLVVDRCRVSV